MMKYYFKSSTLCWLLFLCLFGKLDAQLINNRSQDLPCLEKNFNLRIIMTIDSSTQTVALSETEVNQILKKASSYFEPICISFSSCETEVINNYAYGTLSDEIRVKEAGVLFAYPRRINVFFVQDLGFNEHCGFSYFGGFNSKRKAQIFIELNKKSCHDDPAEQLAHHMGSLLGLRMTNYNEELELVDGSNCATAGDKICDTPADPYNTKLLEKDDEIGFNKECEFVWEGKDSNGEFYLPNTTNIMSPYNCKCEFTIQQYQKMAESFLNSNQQNY